jgi:biopolymer transport protein ExbD
VDLWVDLSPLIDVVFLLLIFFMVSTTFKNDHGMELTLPEANSTVEKNQERLEVVITSEGIIVVEGVAIKLSELKDYLSSEFGDRLTNETVLLGIDRNVSHGRVVKVMDAIKLSGAKGIAFLADEPPGANP